MSKTVDDLVKVFMQAADDTYAAEYIDPADTTNVAWRAGIAAVVRALRDEIVGYQWAENKLNEILGDAGEKVAEDPLPHLSERERALFVAALKGDAGPTTPPATDPAPAVCVWAKEITRGPLDPVWWSRCGRPYDYKRDVCICGKPIKFAEAKT